MKSEIGCFDFCHPPLSGEMAPLLISLFSAEHSLYSAEKLIKFRYFTVADSVGMSLKRKVFIWVCSGELETNMKLGHKEPPYWDIHHLRYDKISMREYFDSSFQVWAQQYKWRPFWKLNTPYIFKWRPV